MERLNEGRKQGSTGKTVGNNEQGWVLTVSENERKCYNAH